MPVNGAVLTLLRWPDVLVGTLGKKSEKLFYIFFVEAIGDRVFDRYCHISVCLYPFRVPSAFVSVFSPLLKRLLDSLYRLFLETYLYGWIYLSDEDNCVRKI